jgi:hypothetical protein
MKTWVLIVIVILALATVAIWTFATATLYRRGQCRTYPYYWCDTNWACCNKDSSNINNNCTAAGGTSGGSYKITDKYYGTTIAPGADDHNSYNHLCIAPANAIVATYPGVPISCLYSPDSSGNPILCPGPSTSNDFDNVPGYNRNAYNPTSNPGGLQGRCTYYSIDDAPDPNTGAVTYSYLPGYGGLPNTSGGYLQQPYLGSTTNTTNYYFAGNSGVGQPPTNGFANGPNQADSTNYSAWNRLGNITAAPP